MNILITEQQYNLITKELGEEYPIGWSLETFKTLRSFNQRIQYCQQNLKRISSGSSRIVYMVDNTKVLKLAKNNKGIAQNETEMQWKDDGYYGGILAKVFDCDDDKSLWVEMELARRVSPSGFQRIVGVPFNEYGYYVSRRVNEINGKPGWSPFKQPEDIRKILDENEFTNTVISFICDTDSPTGDFNRLSSYGLVLRDGVESVVLIDFGLTNDSFNTFYRK